MCNRPRKNSQYLTTHQQLTVVVSPAHPQYLRSVPYTVQGVCMRTTLLPAPRQHKPSAQKRRLESLLFTLHAERNKLDN
jgi:hypothetical protein